jgi:arylsulfatase A-like enzyme
MVAAMDEQVGKIVGAIDRAGISKNTLVFFSSDNGGPRPGKVTSNGPLRGAKGTLYEGGVRVAACVAWPGHIKAGSVVEAPLHIVDLYPTLLKLAGAKLDQPLPLDGRDAWPAITDGKPSPHAEILINVSPAGGAIRVGDWKLVIGGFLNGAMLDRGLAEASEHRRPQLFHLSDDLAERHDVASSHPAKVKEMQARYEAIAREATRPKAKPRPKDFRVPRIWGQAD